MLSQRPSSLEYVHLLQALRFIPLVAGMSFSRVSGSEGVWS